MGVTIKVPRCAVDRISHSRICVASVSSTGRKPPTAHGPWALQLGEHQGSGSSECTDGIKFASDRYVGMH